MARKIFGSLAVLFGVSVGLIFGRLYLLANAPDSLRLWAEPVSFWLLVLILVSFLCLFLGIIYVQSKTRRQRPMERTPDD
jgi:hypothetical protein